MLERMLPYEQDLFFLINGSHTSLMDYIMWLFSGSVVWVPIAIFILFFLIYKKRWREWLPVLIAIVILFVCCDQFSSGLMKPLFARPRPTHYPGIMEHVRILYDYTGGRYGFISGHATNAFGFAMFTVLLFRNKIYSSVIFVWAVIMAYSRVYLGVHFISDVVAGAISGIIIGFIVYKLYAIITKKISVNNKDDFTTSYSRIQVRVISLVIVSYTIFFSLLSKYLITISSFKVW